MTSPEEPVVRRLRGLLAPEDAILKMARRRSLTGYESIDRILSANIHGIGVGQKYVMGRPTDVSAVTVHVLRKFPKSMLPRAHRIPEAIDGVVVDVIEMPLPRVQLGAQGGQLTGECRPLEMGYGTSHTYTMGGTMGAIVEADSHPGQRLLLSCSHVLAPPGCQIGDRVLQPARVDGGLGSSVGVLSGWSDLTGNVSVDVALAALTTVGSNYFGGMLGILNPTPLTASKGMIVVKRGRTSDVTWGLIDRTISKQLVTLETWPGGYRGIWYENQLLVPGSFSQPGDSGALVLERDTRRPVGLVVAGGDEGGGTLVTPIETVLSSSPLGPLRFAA